MNTPDRFSPSKTATGLVKPTGLWFAVVTRVEDSFAFVQVPRLSGTVERGPFWVSGSIPSPGENVLVGFLERGANEMVVFSGLEGDTKFPDLLYFGSDPKVAATNTGASVGGNLIASGGASAGGNLGVSGDATIDQDLLVDGLTVQSTTYLNNLTMNGFVNGNLGPIPYIRQDFSLQTSGQIENPLDTVGGVSETGEGWDGDGDEAVFIGQAGGGVGVESAVEARGIQIPTYLREDVRVYCKMTLGRGAGNALWNGIVVRAYGSGGSETLEVVWDGPASDPNLTLWDYTTLIKTWDLSVLMTSPPVETDTVELVVYCEGDDITLYSIAVNGASPEVLDDTYTLTGTPKTWHGAGSTACWYGLVSHEAVNPGDDLFSFFEVTALPDRVHAEVDRLVVTDHLEVPGTIGPLDVLGPVVSDVPMVVVRRSSNLNFSIGAVLDISWNDEEFDPYQWFEPTATNVVPKMAGYYTASLAVSANGFTIGNRVLIDIEKNGNTIVGRLDIDSPATAAAWNVSVPDLYMNGTTDYVRGRIYAGGSGTATLLYTANSAPRMSLRYLGK